VTKREVFVTVLNMLGETFNRQMTDGLLEGYWMALEDLSPEDMKAATKRALASCKFMPSPSELLAFAGKGQRDLAHEAAIAWDGVRRAVDKIDYTVSFIDFGPHVNAVIRQLGGWDALCTAKLTDLDVWKRKEFERLYIAFAGKTIGREGHSLEGPKDGRVYPAQSVAIPGIPSQPPPPALPPVGGDPQLAMQEHVAELVEMSERKAV
jgi:hypothetical protein